MIIHQAKIMKASTIKNATKIIHKKSDPLISFFGSLLNESGSGYFPILVCESQTIRRRVTIELIGE